VVSNGTATFGAFYAGLVGELGSEVSQATSRFEGQTMLVDSLQNQRDAISGVSVDEELVSLVRFQQAYEAAARYVSVLRELTDTLMRI